MHALAVRIALGWIAVAAAPAQSWSLTGSGPPLSFGIASDLVVRDAAGRIGFDEANAALLLQHGVAWSTVPTIVPPRLGATLVAANGRAYLFGGVTATGFDTTTWRFTRATHAWAPMGGAASQPTARVGARAASVSGVPIVLFGGFDGTAFPNDTWVMLDVLGTAVWVQQPATAALVGRVRHTMASAPGHSVLLFGGQQAQPLGDTWVFHGTTWTQHFGARPPAAADCQMTYDPGRDVTVLIHPNGDTWEWNGLRWRRVGATGAPPWTATALVMSDSVDGTATALRSTATSLDTWTFTPSPARWEITIDLACSADGATGLELDTFERSLPILGQALHLRATGLLSGGAFVGAFELASNVVVLPMPCECFFSLDGTAAVTQFVPGTGTVRDWLLPVANDPVLIGVPIHAQGVVFDAAAPCAVMTTQRGTLVPGL